MWRSKYRCEGRLRQVTSKMVGTSVSFFEESRISAQAEYGIWTPTKTTSTTTTTTTTQTREHEIGASQIYIDLVISIPASALRGVKHVVVPSTDECSVRWRYLGHRCGRKSNHTWLEQCAREALAKTSPYLGLLARS